MSACVGARTRGEHERRTMAVAAVRKLGVVPLAALLECLDCDDGEVTGVALERTNERSASRE